MNGQFVANPPWLKKGRNGNRKLAFCPVGLKPCLWKWNERTLCETPLPKKKGSARLFEKCVVWGACPKPGNGKPTPPANVALLVWPTIEKGVPMPGFAVANDDHVKSWLVMPEWNTCVPVIGPKLTCGADALLCVPQAGLQLPPGCGMVA